MKADSIIPDSIYDQSAAAFDEVIGRLYQIDLSALLLYVIDHAPADALPWLAEQFHVLGYEGWAFVSTEAQKRQLIKNAIALHRYKGTPWSIKNAIKSIFNSLLVTVYEGYPAMQYDGTCQYDGTHRHNPGDVFMFDVSISDEAATVTESADPAGLVYDLSVQYNSSARYSSPKYRHIRSNAAKQHIDTIIGLINEYKNARSHLRRLYGEDEEYHGFQYNASAQYDDRRRHIGEDILIVKSILREV